MFAGSSTGMGTRGGVRSGNGTGLTTLQVANTSGSVGGINAGMPMPDSGRYGERESVDVVLSCSDAESDSGDDEDIGSAGDRRGVKRERAEMEVGSSSGAMALAPGGYGASAGGVAGAKPGKKTRGRVKIKMEFIDNKLRRYTTFSKRKTGIMKKAYELSTLTGTQVLLLVASETGHVYTFATRKLQPMITSETGKALIQTCLNSPDSPAPRPGTGADPSSEQRMSATGFEETELSYQVAEGTDAVATGTTGDQNKVGFTLSSLQGGAPSATSTPPSSSSSSSSPPPLPSSSSSSSSTAAAAAAPCWSGVRVGVGGALQSANASVLKSTIATHAPSMATPSIATATSSAGIVLPPGFTIMSGTALPPGTHTIPLSQLQTHALTIQPPPAAPAASAASMPVAASAVSIGAPAVSIGASVGAPVGASAGSSAPLPLAQSLQTLQAPCDPTATPQLPPSLAGVPIVTATALTTTGPAPGPSPQPPTSLAGVPIVTATTLTTTGPVGPALPAPATALTHTLQPQQPPLHRHTHTPSYACQLLSHSQVSAALPQQVQVQVQSSSSQQGGASGSSSGGTTSSNLNHATSVSHAATIITSSSSSVAAAGHMMYPSPHTLMYATPTQTLTADGGGGLTVLNPFPPVSHSQPQEPGAIPQMFFTSPQGTVQIPVSAVPLHSMLIGQQPGGGSSNLTELRVVSLDQAKAD
ncbi:hypothetical protein ACEWY4_017201 [Coilia grayii]|uniref:Serum response factor n=1 Tax=Coilia grayii TaxID=363190 RepID=A0ABD1JGG2_9TELE